MAASTEPERGGTKTVPPLFLWLANLMLFGGRPGVVKSLLDNRVVFAKRLS
jgi:hypothetical protein